jgi:hypothetical protein
LPASGVRKLRANETPPKESVSEEFLNPARQPAQQTAPQPERLPLLSRFSDLFSGILDSFSSFFFYLSFSSLTHLLSSWWSRF